MELILAGVVGALFCVVVYLLRQLQLEREGYDERYTAWDVERGRYVAALLSQGRAGDLAASSVVRPRPAKPAEEPKKVMHPEGM